MFLILTLIVLVAALNIVSGLIMLVKDKGSDIAILRTMGATQGDHAGISDHRRGDRRGRHHDGFLPWSACCLPEYRIDPAIPVLAHQHRIVFAGALFPLANCRPTWISAKPRPWW
jgi:hypothetical protein